VSHNKRSRSKHLRDDLRTAESQEDINGPFRKPTAEDGPQFITSAIEMDGVKLFDDTSNDLSMDSPMSWRIDQNRKRDFNL
jgi:hypothetical protein